MIRELYGRQKRVAGQALMNLELHNFSLTLYIICAYTRFKLSPTRISHD